MYRDTFSEEYDTVKIFYPEHLNMKCPVCGSKVKYKMKDNGKLVRTLKGDVHQIVSLYICSNENCLLYNKAFNPTPRLDYSQRSIGRDVLQTIADYFLRVNMNPAQIVALLELNYDFNISESTVRRIMDDIIVAKSARVDENTKRIVRERGAILLALDGQDPGSKKKAIWCFTDLLSARILMTRALEKADYITLNECIEEVLQTYQVPLVGIVSDKQGSIVKCCREYYPDVPHQYCTYHFLSHLWEHMTAFDAGVYSAIRSAVKGLSLMKASPHYTVNFEEIGRKPVREVFDALIKNLEQLLGRYNKKFTFIRGKWAHESATTLLNYLRDKLARLRPELRYTKIIARVAKTLEDVLDSTREAYGSVLHMLSAFNEVRELLMEPQMPRDARVRAISSIFNKLYRELEDEGFITDRSAIRSHLPRRGDSYADAVAQWVRLWDSYRVGLFQYYKFPLDVRTNVLVEHGFSLEKASIIRRVARGDVSSMISTHGELYLRLKHYSTDELSSDISEDFSLASVSRLLSDLGARQRAVSSSWRTSNYSLLDVSDPSSSYYLTDLGV